MTKTISGSFTGTGQSSTIELYGDFAYSLSGFGTATVRLERSFDNGATWKVVRSDTADIENNGKEVLSKVLYRVNCSAYTSGTIVYRVSQNGFLYT
jgi:hypothetical protein